MQHQPPRIVIPLLLWLMLLLSCIVLLVAVWIVLPAFRYELLPLTIATPELSPGLLIVAVLLALTSLVMVYSLRLSTRGKKIGQIALLSSLFSVVLTSLPLIQVPVTLDRANLAIQSQLGQTAFQSRPPNPAAPWRDRPLRLEDVFQGIAIPQVRENRGIPVANPDGVPLTMKVYRPLSRGQNPTVVTIYGGSWQRGSPAENAQFNRYLSAQGYTVIAIDYRHAPTYRFPAQLTDVQTALQFIQDHAEEYEVDVGRMAVMGRSAGAQLALLLAYQPEQSPFKAVINYYGPTDLAAGYRQPPTPDPVGTHAVLEAFLGGSPDQFPDQYQQASPLYQVQPQLPPTLLIYGGHDRVVEAKHGRWLHDRLLAHQVRSVLIELPWADHVFDVVFNGISNQLALYYTERFLSWALA